MISSLTRGGGMIQALNVEITYRRGSDGAYRPEVGGGVEGSAIAAVIGTLFPLKTQVSFGYGGALYLLRPSVARWILEQPNIAAAYERSAWYWGRAQVPAAELRRADGSPLGWERDFLTPAVWRELTLQVIATLQGDSKDARALRDAHPEWFEPWAPELVALDPQTGLPFQPVPISPVKGAWYAVQASPLLQLGIGGLLGWLGLRALGGR